MNDDEKLAEHEDIATGEGAVGLTVDGARFMVGPEIPRHASRLDDTPPHVSLHEVDWIDPPPAGLPPVLLKADNGGAVLHRSTTADREAAAFRAIADLRASAPATPGLAHLVRCFGVFSERAPMTYFLLEKLGDTVWDRSAAAPMQRPVLAEAVLRDGLAAVSALAAAGIAIRDAHPANFLLPLDDVDGRGRLTLIDFGHAYAVDNHGLSTDNTVRGWAWVQPAPLHARREHRGQQAGLVDDAFSVAATAFIVATGGTTPWFVKLRGARMPVPSREHIRRRAEWELGDRAELHAAMRESGCSDEVVDLAVDIMLTNADVREADAASKHAAVAGWLARASGVSEPPATLHEPTDESSGSSEPARSMRDPAAFLAVDPEAAAVDEARAWLAEKRVRGIATRAAFDTLPPFAPPVAPWTARATPKVAAGARTIGGFALGLVSDAASLVAQLLRGLFADVWRTLGMIAVAAVVAMVFFQGWGGWWYRPFFVLPWTFDTFTWWQWLIAASVAAVTLLLGAAVMFRGGSHVIVRLVQALALVALVTAAGAGISLGFAQTTAAPGTACTEDADRNALCVDTSPPGGWEVQPGAGDYTATTVDGEIVFEYVSARHDCLTAQVIASQAEAPAAVDREIPWGDGSRSATEDAQGVAPLRFAPAGTNVWQRHTWTDEHSDTYDRARSYTLVTGSPFGARDAGGVARATLGTGLTQTSVVVREAGCPLEWADTADDLGESLVAAVHPVDIASVDPRLISAHATNASGAGIAPIDWYVPVSGDLIPRPGRFVEEGLTWQLAVTLLTSGDEPVELVAWIDEGDGYPADNASDRAGWTWSDSGVDRTYKALVTRDGVFSMILLAVPLGHVDDPEVIEAVRLFMDDVTVFGQRPDGSG